MTNVFFISEMHCNGLYVDKEHFYNKAKPTVIDTCQELLAMMLATPFKAYTSNKFFTLPDTFNPNSQPQVRSFCFAKLKCPKLAGTRKSKDRTSTKNTVLERWDKQYDINFARHLLKYRAVSVHKSNLISHVENFLNPVTGCVHPDIKMWGTETGRLSVSKPPLHGLPSRGDYAKIVRKIFAAPDGYVIIGADYSQIELRIIAWDSGAKELLKAYELGLDMHSHTTALMFSVPIELLEKEENKWMRYIGKTCNFGLCYGGSAKVLLEQIGNRLDPNAQPSDIIPEAKLLSYAESYRKQFFKAYPELTSWRTKRLQFARNHEYALSAYGRIRYVPAINSTDAYTKFHAENQALNHTIQSTASDYQTFRFQDIITACREQGIAAKPIISIHDAIYFLVPKGTEEKAIEITKDIGIRQDETNITVPMILEPKVGTNFSDFIE
jgi:DNA polymerase-1